MFGGRREQRQEDRQQFGIGGSAKQYKMRQNLISFGDDFWIEDSRGQRVYKVDGKVLRIRDTLIIKDMHGTEVAKLQEKMVRIKDTMEIQGPNGATIAVVKKALITPLRERYVVKIGTGPDLDVQGNLLDHEYSIGEGRDKIAEVSKKWFRISDSYGVQIEEGQNDGIILAVTIAIDMISHGGR